MYFLEVFILFISRWFNLIFHDLDNIFYQMYLCPYLNSVTTFCFQISEFKDQLFFAAGLQPDKLLEFSCGESGLTFLLK